MPWVSAIYIDQVTFSGIADCTWLIAGTYALRWLCIAFQSGMSVLLRWSNSLMPSDLEVKQRRLHVACVHGAPLH